MTNVKNRSKFHEKRLYFAIFLPWMASYGSETTFLLIFSARSFMKIGSSEVPNQVTSPYFDQLTEKCQPLRISPMATQIALGLQGLLAHSSFTAFELSSSFSFSSARPPSPPPNLSWLKKVSTFSLTRLFSSAFSAALWFWRRVGNKPMIVRVSSPAVTMSVSVALPGRYDLTSFSPAEEFVPLFSVSIFNALVKDGSRSESMFRIWKQGRSDLESEEERGRWRFKSGHITGEGQ